MDWLSFVEWKKYCLIQTNFATTKNVCLKSKILKGNDGIYVRKKYMNEKKKIPSASNRRENSHTKKSIELETYLSLFEKRIQRV